MEDALEMNALFCKTLCDTSSVAELLVMDGFKKVCLYAFGARIAEVAATENPTEQQLLTAPPISEIIYDEQNSKIVKVVRPYYYMV